MRTTLVSLAVLLLVGCEQKSGFMVGSAPVDECTVTLDTLPGTTWVMLEPHPERGDVPNPQARARFTADDGAITLEYNAKSLGDMYEYSCEKQGEELVCLQALEAEHVEAMCRALEAHEEGACTVDAIEEIGVGDLSGDVVKKAVEAGKAQADKARDENWQAFVARNNNVGNKIRGKFYAKVDQRRCRLRVTDMFVGIHDGETFEDSNVVGTNPFVQAEADELFFEHCGADRGLVDLPVPERLERDEIPAERVHELGQAVHYRYYGDAAAEPEEGCTYSMDVWAQWQPVGKGVEAPVADGRIDWHTSHTWTDGEALTLVNPFKPQGILGVVRYQRCGDGDKEQIDVVCNAAQVNVPDAAPDEG